MSMMMGAVNDMGTRVIDMGTRVIDMGTYVNEMGTGWHGKYSYKIAPLFVGGPGTPGRICRNCLRQRRRGLVVFLVAV
jgi:hypothetical protein